MALLKQSRAYTRNFLMVKSTGIGAHITGQTGANPQVTLSKAGAAFAAAGGTVTELTVGWYKIVLTTTDTNTLGDLSYHITGTGADPTDFTDQVVAVDVEDALAFGMSRLDAAITTRMATFTLPTNFSTLSIDGSGRIDLAKWVGVAPNGLISGRVDANAQVVGDKTGYALSAAGLDSIPITDPGGPATTYPAMAVQLWRYQFKKADLTATELRTYADNGTTVNTTQAVSDVAGVQTRDAAT